MFKYKESKELILGSTSPRRKELLDSLALSYCVVAPDAAEDPFDDEAPDAMVRRLAFDKANSVAALHPESWIIGADTTVFINSRILGKPADKDDAFRMLSEISGKAHEVWGGISLIGPGGKYINTESFCSKVWLRKLSESEIIKYVASGEPMDKAGAYAIQGLGASLVERVEGSYTNVVGLNLSALVQMMQRAGIIE